MKRFLRLSAAIFLCSFFTTTFAQQRYEDEIFTDSEVVVWADSMYAINWNSYVPASLGGPQLVPLRMDIYQPDPNVDTETQRPVIIYLHTGSFLPEGIASPMGGKADSAAVEFCRRFARRGYVAVSADYRTGWLADNTDLNLRRGTNLIAVYNAVQDAKSAVRYLRNDALNRGNNFGIDESKIALLGQQSGGYITFAYATLDKHSELVGITKFQYDANMSSGIFGDPVSIGDPYVDTTILGDWDGFGGAVSIIGTHPSGLPLVDTAQTGRNYINTPGISSDVSMVMNMGGALGDSTWLEAGDIPMVSVHVVEDFFAPYTMGMVQVPIGANFFPVVEVSGSYHAIQLANQLGNNNIFVNASFSDPITSVALNHPNNPGSYEGILPFSIPPPNAAMPFRVNSNPWDWWDPAHPLSANETNPNVKSQSLMYIDTVVNYLNPRLITVFGLPTANIDEQERLNSRLKVYPNPAQSSFTVSLDDLNSTIERIEMTDIRGVAVRSEIVNAKEYVVHSASLPAGFYLLSIHANDVVVTRKISIQ